jgi:DNA mismatch endonuclease, patch repair protein
MNCVPENSFAPPDVPPHKPALTRSEQMSRIRGSNTTPERVLGRALWALGYRYRLRTFGLVGRPDLVLRKLRVVIFVDGCFWHGCPEHYVRPRSRAAFWARKLRENVLRDIRQTADLHDTGWRVLRVWEHEVLGRLAALLMRLVPALLSTRRARARHWRVLRARPLDRLGVREQRELVSLSSPARRRHVRVRRHTRKW